MNDGRGRAGEAHLTAGPALGYVSQLEQHAADELRAAYRRPGGLLPL